MGLPLAPFAAPPAVDAAVATIGAVDPQTAAVWCLGLALAMLVAMAFVEGEARW